MSHVIERPVGVKEWPGIPQGRIFVHYTFKWEDSSAGPTVVQPYSTIKVHVWKGAESAECTVGCTDR